MMGRSRMILGWFNAWIGFASVVLFIPSYLFIFNYEGFLQRSFVPTLVYLIDIDLKRDSSEIEIKTDKGNFYHYNKGNYKIITELAKEHKTVEIWYDKEDRNTADFKSDGEFLFKRTALGITLYLIGLIISGTMMVLSTLLIIKTKGWGTYDLMEKHSKRD